MNLKRKFKAFTLIELLVVITIIGILMVLILVTIQPIQKRSRDSKRKADVNLFLSGLNLFQADFKLYPNYTFYLGKNGNPTDAGAANSYLDLGTDLASCSGAQMGDPVNFAKNASTPIGDGGGYTDPGGKPLNDSTSYDNIVLKPGFQSVNQFLVCLKYLDRIIVDPKPTTDPNNYQYRLSYDYSQVLVNAQAENQNDPGLIGNLFPNSGGANINPLRYFEGNGKNVRQLDDDTNKGNEFFNWGMIIINGADTDGRYFYQCTQKSSDGSALTRDNRVLSTYNPIISSAGSFIANPNCQTTNLAPANVTVQSH